jgi:hypothetical protein
MAPSSADCQFVLMLTRHDRTVPNAHEILEEALAAGVRHIGFKDVGLPLKELMALVEEIRKANGTAYLEIVRLDEASEAASASLAVELGVDHLLGGTRPEVVLPNLAGTSIAYWPFPGRVVGHPSRLEGSIEEIVTSAQSLASLSGVVGLDLLAYRYAGDTERLIVDVVRSVSKPVLVAGSIDGLARIASVVSAGAAAFTVGTAVLDHAFANDSPLSTQIKMICQAKAAARPSASEIIGLM